MHKAENGLNTSGNKGASLSKRTLLATMAGAAVAVGAASALASPAASQLYLDAVAAYQGWLDSCEVWGNLPHAHRDYAHLTKHSDDLSDKYEALFRECCAAHVAAPSLTGIGEVCALWQIRCWHDPEGMDQMTDEFEARSLLKIIEAVTGIIPPRKLLAYT